VPERVLCVDNAVMTGLRRLLAAVLAATCSAGCGAHRVTPAPISASPHVTAVATSSSIGVPPLGPQAQVAGLVDVRTVVPDAIIDLRYATPNNFVGVAMYPADARCLVDQSMAQGLAAAAEALRPKVLVFWDCYRPHDVQVRMWEAVPNPAWVARPGSYARSHEAGRSVDVTVAGAQGLVDMGTDFDDFSPRAVAFATQGVSAEQQANRAELRAAMNAGGLTVYSGEWWHFDGPGAYVERPILDVPVD
jgi:zinc D-Ala-D-Ala dipeptidase